MKQASYGWMGAVFAAALLMVACQEAASQQETRTTSFLSGQITVDPALDSTGNHGGFEVIVLNQAEAGLDTLGFARTARDGSFAMAVTAPDRGVYPLVITRNGRIIKVDELALATGDSAAFSVVLPDGGRPLRIRSTENAAWAAYRNTRYQHAQTVTALMAEPSEASGAAMAQSAGLTANILWNMRETFPGTVGAALAAAEGVLILEGWNDSLLDVRAAEITPENPGYVDVARAHRRAVARLQGQEAALELLARYRAQTLRDDHRAALLAEEVAARVDSLDRAGALATARDLRQAYPGSPWAGWAERAIYELENLMPGMPAPDFAAETVRGQPVTLELLRGHLVLLEFYVPEDPVFRQQIPGRNALVRSADDGAFTVVSISLQPEAALNEALLESVELPGLHVWDARGAGSPLAQRYNVTTLPTRVLIDAQGRLVGKYTGNAFAPLLQDVARLLNR